MKKYLSGLFLAAVAATPAMSADLAYKAPPPAMYSPVPVQNWSGWYVGMHGGYSSGTLQSPQLANFGVNSEPERWMIGFQAGVREQVAGNFVLGAQVAIPLFGETINQGSPFLPAGSFAAVKTGFTIIPSVQLGYALGRWLPFIGFGVGVSEQKITTFNLPGALNQSVNKWVPVTVSTLGIDYAVTSNWQIGARYNYIYAPMANYVFASGGPVPAVIQAGLSSHGITGVLQYRFQ